MIVYAGVLKFLQIFRSVCNNGVVILEIILLTLVHLKEILLFLMESTSLEQEIALLRLFKSQVNYLWLHENTYFHFEKFWRQNELQDWLVEKVFMSIYYQLTISCQWC